MIEPLEPVEAILRVVIAAVLGGLIGFDRERRNKAAGIRTHMLVAMGAALFMASAYLIADDLGDQDAGAVALRVDPTRMAQGIVTGVGFIGAGQIFQSHGNVQGLTSAAGIWVTAAIGLLVGLGYYAVPIASTVLVVLVIGVLGALEARVMDDEDDAEESEK